MLSVKGLIFILFLVSYHLYSQIPSSLTENVKQTFDILAPNIPYVKAEYKRRFLGANNKVLIKIYSFSFQNISLDLTVHGYYTADKSANDKISVTFVKNLQDDNRLYEIAKIPSSSNSEQLVSSYDVSNRSGFKKLPEPKITEESELITILISIGNASSGDGYITVNNITAKPIKYYFEFENNSVERKFLSDIDKINILKCDTNSKISFVFNKNGNMYKAKNIYLFAYGNGINSGKPLEGNCKKYDKDEKNICIISLSKEFINPNKIFKFSDRSTLKENSLQFNISSKNVQECVVSSSNVEVSVDKPKKILDGLKPGRVTLPQAGENY